MRIVIGFSTTFLISLVFSTSEAGSYQTLEGSLSGVLGALLGGIVAAISIIFGLLTTRNEKFQTYASKNKKFEAFINSLKKDTFILLGCTFFSVFLPYIRNVNISFLKYPDWFFLPSKNYLFTTFELMLVIISFVVIIEIISVLFDVFTIALKPEHSENKSEK